MNYTFFREKHDQRKKKKKTKERTFLLVRFSVIYENANDKMYGNDLGNQGSKFYRLDTKSCYRTKNQYFIFLSFLHFLFFFWKKLTIHVFLFLFYFICTNE